MRSIHGAPQTGAFPEKASFGIHSSALTDGVLEATGGSTGSSVKTGWFAETRPSAATEKNTLEQPSEVVWHLQKDDEVYILTVQKAELQPQKRIERHITNASGDDNNSSIESNSDHDPAAREDEDIEHGNGDVVDSFASDAELNKKELVAVVIGIDFFFNALARGQCC